MTHLGKCERALREYRALVKSYRLFAESAVKLAERPDQREPLPSFSARRLQLDKLFLREELANLANLEAQLAATVDTGKTSVESRVVEIGRELPPQFVMPGRDEEPPLTFVQDPEIPYLYCVTIPEHWWKRPAVSTADPYLTTITEDVDPADVLRPPPSRWRRLLHNLGLHRTP